MWLFCEKESHNREGDLSVCEENEQRSIYVML